MFEARTNQSEEEEPDTGDADLVPDVTVPGMIDFIGVIFESRIFVQKG